MPEEAVKTGAPKGAKAVKTRSVSNIADILLVKSLLMKSTFPFVYKHDHSRAYPVKTDKAG
jgi:hypothetical protein